ncbi:MAG: peptidoglycan DD-metalloendopeptidase family protein [Ferruginibacter sp.]|nr:peptidoglycan DD-metalloendopeptidase family protein [Ferruginibacter sp.]
MNNTTRLSHLLQKYSHDFFAVVPFDKAKDNLLHMNFTASNTELTAALLNDVDAFSAYVSQKITAANCKYAIGGYAEDRVVYSVHNHFANKSKPRTIHLGIDIWGEVNTPIHAPLGGMVHSVAYNNNKGDYGATIILQHQLETIPFHTLYGHLSLQSIANVTEGQYINRGNSIGYFGNAQENGGWPPHLHFQVIEDMELKEGDYPGVCTKDEQEKYLNNCPNPDLILTLMQYIK